MEAELGKTYVNPASHGEGRFVAPKEWIDKLFANGQVATQYADINGNISMDEEWKTVDTVYDNLELDTERLLKEPVQARYVRLNVTKPDQSEGNTVRIYEFVVF